MIQQVCLNCDDCPDGADPVAFMCAGCLQEEVERLRGRRCKTCRHWEDDTVRVGKRCGNDEKVGEYRWTKGADDALTYVYSEDGWFKPGPKFGCVHHEPRE